MRKIHTHVQTVLLALTIAIIVAMMEKKMAKKTIKDAVEKLPKIVADHIVRMFNNTHTLDYYDGNLEMYLKLIEQDVSNTKRTVARMERILAEVRSHVL